MAALADSGAAQEARRAEAVFVYAELRGFTGMSQMLEPGVAVRLLEQFHAWMDAQLTAQDGHVLQRTGDTLLAVFEQSGDAARAIRASQEALQGFAALEAAWREGYGLHTAVAMGLHRGPAVMARDQAIGECVGIANRLLHRARAGEIVFSTTVLDALAQSGVELDAEPLPPLELAQRAPMRIYGVLLPERLDFT